MQDEVKLIYLYQLGAEGFRSGDAIDHPDYIDTIMKVTNDSHEEYQSQYRMQNLTPQVMAKIMLSWLCEKGSI
jgi:hypothetical protein